jgi:DNA-binding CsgD family transcriptional regulator
MSATSLRFTESAVTGAIAAIYEAAVAPDRWRDALWELRKMFGLESTAYVVHDADRTRIERITAEIDPDGHRANVNSLLRGSIYNARDHRGYTGQIVRAATLVPNKVFHRSRMYEEYWRPRALHDALRMTVLVDESNVYHAFNLIKPKSTGMFEESDIELAHVLMPHLRRAVELRRRLGQVNMLAAAALAALDALQHPVLLLDKDGRVSHANTSGGALLSKADGLGASHGLLFTATPALTARLHAMLARAAGAGGQPARASAMRLPLPADGGALALLAMPFQHEAHWSLPRQHAILLFVTDPSVVSAAPNPRLAELFGLTRSEATLAADLLAGDTLSEIAARRGRSVNTVRSHLAQLMAKTNVNRQSHLMRLLASLPRSPDPV